MVLEADGDRGSDVVEPSAVWLAVEGNAWAAEIGHDFRAHVHAALQPLPHPTTHEN